MKKNIFILLIFISINSYSYIPVGLQNLGATCFANSALQVLYSLDPIRNFLLKPETKNIYEENSFATSLIDFFNEYSTAKETYKPTNIINKLWSLKQKETVEEPAGSGKYVSKIVDIFPQGTTGDQTEALSKMTETLTEDLKAEAKKEFYGYPNNNKIETNVSKLFYSFLRKTFNYQKDDKLMTLPTGGELSIYLNLDVLDHSLEKPTPYDNLTECLRAYCSPYAAENTIFQDGDNGKNYDGIIMKQFYLLPEILIIKYKRKVINIETGQEEKIFKGIPFDLELDLTNFIDEKQIGQIETKYELIGIFMHYGTGAHCAAFIKTDDQWYECNDSSITKIETNYIEDLSKQKIEKLDPTPYGLIYKSKNPQPTYKQLITEEQFDAEIEKDKIAKEYLDDYLKYYSDKVITKETTKADLIKGINMGFVTTDTIIQKINEFVNQTKDKLNTTEKLRNELEKDPFIKENLYAYLQHDPKIKKFKGVLSTNGITVSNIKDLYRLFANKSINQEKLKADMVVILDDIKAKNLIIKPETEETEIIKLRTYIDGSKSKEKIIIYMKALNLNETDLASAIAKNYINLFDIRFAADDHAIENNRISLINFSCELNYLSFFI